MGDLQIQPAALKARFFVTGAAGFVGRHLCGALREQGHEVRGLARRADATLPAPGVELVRGDLSAPAAWQERLAGIDYVIHCAAQARFGNGPEFHAVNVLGTANLLAAANRHAAGLRRLVFVSTIGAIDRAPGDGCAQPLTEDSPAHPSSDYGRSKWAAEKLVRGSGLPFAIVRPGMVVGGDMPSDSHFAVFARHAVRGTALARFAWPGEFSVVHVDDLARALEICATHPAAAGRTFFCAGAPVSVARCFALAAPGAARVPLAPAAACARAVPAVVPFRFKALLRPALTASDAPLRELGWKPQRAGTDALTEVIARERARRDPGLDPGGQTIVTGAASGLGRALVDLLAPRRQNLLLIDRDASGLAAIQASHRHCRTAVVDLADEAAVAALTGGEPWRTFPVRELFACAGIGIRGPMLDAPAEQHARLFKINVLSRLALAHAALPEMIRAQFGRVVFISSSSAFQPLAYMASYAASNAALLHLGEAWGAELAGSGVHMMQVCPGGMQTNFQKSAGVREIPGERLMAPADVASRIWRGLARGQPTLIVSARSFAMALLARVLPRRTTVALWRRLMTALR